MTLNCRSFCVNTLIKEISGKSEIYNFEQSNTSRWSFVSILMVVKKGKHCWAPSVVKTLSSM